MRTNGEAKYYRYCTETPEKNTGVAYRYEFLHQETEKTPFDCKVFIDFDGNHREYFYIVRKEIREHQIRKLQQLVTDKTLLIAERIYPKMKTILKAFNINFFDMQGNICLKDKGVFLFVQHQGKNTMQVKTKKLFTAAELKVVFNLLISPELINQTYSSGRKAFVIDDFLNRHN